MPYALMHMRGDPCTMVLPENTAYGDVATEVGMELQAQAEAALAAGIQPWRILLDPGALAPPPPAHPRTGTASLPAAVAPCTPRAGRPASRALRLALPKGIGALLGRRGTVPCLAPRVASAVGQLPVPPMARGLCAVTKPGLLVLLTSWIPSI